MMRKQAALVLTALLTATSVGHGAARQDATDAAVRHLRTAVTSQRDGSHLAMLFSLRQLRDPSLRPLFHQLVQHAEWQVQVHAVLGLAELSENERLDPWLVAQIDPTAQEAVIASGLDMKLLGIGEIRELLAAPVAPDPPESPGRRSVLPTLSRLMLYAELHVLGEAAPHDSERVRTFAEHENLRIAGLASLLLAEGNEPAAFIAFRERFGQCPSSERRRVTPWLVDAIRQYELKSAAPWLRDLLEATNDETAARTLILALMTLDPVQHLDVVKRSLESDPSYRNRVHFGLLLLSCGDGVPPEAYELVRGTEELTVAMADAGVALSTPDSTKGAAETLIQLISLDHPRSMEWAMHAVKELPDAQARHIYIHVLESLDQPERASGLAERAATAVAAVARLFEIDPDEAISRLLAAPEDSLVHQVLLLGLLDSRSPRAGEVAKQLRRGGFGRADSMATLLVAKHAETLAPEDLRRLGMIASGGGRVSEPLRAQAAWLYIKHTGQVEAALGRMFATR